MTSQKHGESNSDARLLRRMAEDAARGVLENAGGGGHSSGMDGDRISKLESAIDGLRHSQNLIWGGVLAFGALIVTLQLFTLNEVNGVTDKITEEFRAMRTETAATTSAIANSITATKQQAPQVILVPAPQVQQPAQTPQ